MGSSALLSIAARAMLVNQGAMHTVGHNIANASVEGYTRQRAELSTAQGQFTGAGFFGRGVNLTTVTRSYNEFLTRQSIVARSQSSHDVARSEQLARLEDVFKGGEMGLGAAVGDFLNAMVDVANRPQDLTARQVVLGRAGELASRFAAAGGELDTLQAGVTLDMKGAVATVNQLASRIASANQQIAAQQGTGHSPNDLLDQRDQLIAELSTYVNVTTIGADDGSLGVFIAGGQRLVLGAQTSSLAVAPDIFDGSRVALSIIDNGVSRPLDEGLLASGSIGGMLRFQNQDLVDARNLVGQMSTSVAFAVNGQQALGLTIGNPATAGAPMFSLGAPQALAASSNARDAGGNFVARVSMTVVDARQLMPSEYRLSHDGANWQLTRQVDGLTRAVASGDVVDGFRIDLGAPAPAPTDRFLLQPVSRAANSMRQVLTDPRGLAAASPVSATAGAANTGSASIASLAVVSPTVNPQLTATINFTSATGNYTWELRDRTTNALNSSGTATWSAGTPIALNGFELQLAGVPNNGDSFSVDKTAYPASNNGNALALLNLRDKPMVGLVAGAAASLTGGATFTDAWASALAEIGVRVQGASTAADISSQVAESAKASLSGFSGVNLDEEAARLMQYQQGYQAAAKALQIAQSMFDTLLDIGR